MRVIETADQPPGCDLFTLSDKGPFIDTELDIDDAPAYGRIIVARATVEDWGQTFGMLPADATARLQEELGELRMRVVAQDDTITNLRAVIESMSRAGYKEAEMTKPTPTEIENIAANRALELVVEEENLSDKEVAERASHTVGMLTDDDIGRRFTWAALEVPDDDPYTAVLSTLVRADVDPDDPDVGGEVTAATFTADLDGRELVLPASEPIWYVEEPDAPADVLADAGLDAKP